jgi:plastocyanin domain-containing protein
MQVNNNIYGVLFNGAHTDISKSLKATKRYATMNGFKHISIRYNGGYIAVEIFAKDNKGKWIDITCVA